MFADAFFPTFSVNDLIEMPSSPASSTAFNNSPIQLFEYKFLAAVNFSWLSTLRLLALRASSSSDSGRFIVAPGIAFILSSAL